MVKRGRKPMGDRARTSLVVSAKLSAVEAQLFADLLGAVGEERRARGEPVKTKDGRPVMTPSGLVRHLILAEVERRGGGGHG
jgi:hypothetical protein